MSPGRAIVAYLAFAIGLWLIAGATWAWALSAPAEPTQRIVIGGLAADQCGATPDAPVIAGDE